MKRIPLLFAPLLTCQVAFAEDEETVNRSASESNKRNWKIVAGAGIASVPRYEGAATNRLRGVPLLDVEYGRWFAGTSRGIGYNFSDTPHLQYGPRLSVSPYRRQTADARLNGMGDIGYGAEFGGFLNARFAPWYVASSLASGSHGARLEAEGGYEIQLSAADRVRFGAAVNWGNGKYMQTYFGVTAPQATASGGVLSAYNAGSGLKDYELKAGWNHAFTRAWFGNATLTYKQLAGSAKNSPLALRNASTAVSLVVGYRF